ncbi:MAG: lamin tail domain-containing protein [Byssovorax sp.]
MRARALKVRTAKLVGLFALFTWAAACQSTDPVVPPGSGGAAGAGGMTTSAGTTTAATTTSTTSTGSASTTGAGGDQSTSSGSTSGTGGAKPCASASECPGTDTECKKRACNAGACDFDLTAEDTLIAAQTAKDCSAAQCDGQGAIKMVADNADLPDDMNDCTADTCVAGVPTFTTEPAGSACAQNGGTKCSAGAKCVECVVGADCVSLICDSVTFKCALASCNDTTKNGGETDVDCGGATCTPCAPGLVCAADADCVGGLCAALVCAPTCTDGITNNGESDVDCGGPSCAKCDLGKTCNAGPDCKTGSCVAGMCACANDHLVFSEIRSRGLGGTTDEFIEIYNPTAADVILDATWKIEGRSNNAAGYSARWTGSGKTISSHGHYLIASGGYVQTPAKEDSFAGASSITDATSLRLMNTGTVIDAVCYGYSAATKATLMGAGYTCEGTPADNLPHKDAAGAGDVDVSIQRLPGGALGNCIDTGDNAADFVTTKPALPQNTMSTATP